MTGRDYHKMWAAFTEVVCRGVWYCRMDPWSVMASLLESVPDDVTIGELRALHTKHRACIRTQPRRRTHA